MYLVKLECQVKLLYAIQVSVVFCACQALLLPFCLLIKIFFYLFQIPVKGVTLLICFHHVFFSNTGDHSCTDSTGKESSVFVWFYFQRHLFFCLQFAKLLSMSVFIPEY